MLRRTNGHAAAAPVFMPLASIALNFFLCRYSIVYIEEDWLKERKSGQIDFGVGFKSIPVPAAVPHIRTHALCVLILFSLVCNSFFFQISPLLEE